ncbi:MAG: hypothetical protein ACRCXZ_05070 [Patescibacteria group bacterium]
MINETTFHDIVMLFWNQNVKYVGVYELFYKPMNTWMGTIEPSSQKGQKTEFRVGLSLTTFDIEGKLVKFITSCYKVRGEVIIEFLNSKKEVLQEFSPSKLASLIPAQVPFRVIKGWWEERREIIELTYTHVWESSFEGNIFKIDDLYAQYTQRSFSLSLDASIGTDLDGFVPLLEFVEDISYMPFDIFYEQIDYLQNYQG